MPLAPAVSVCAISLPARNSRCRKLGVNASIYRCTTSRLIPIASSQIQAIIDAMAAAKKVAFTIGSRMLRCPFTTRRQPPSDCSPGGCARRNISTIIETARPTPVARISPKNSRERSSSLQRERVTPRAIWYIRFHASSPQQGKFEDCNAHISLAFPSFAPAECERLM